MMASDAVNGTSKTNHVGIEAARQQHQAVGRRALDQRLGEIRIGRMRVAIAHQLHRDHRAQATHFTDAGELALELAQALHEDVADLIGTRRQLLLLHHFDHGERSGTADRRTCIRATETAGDRRIHDLLLADDGRQRESAREALRHGHQIRLDAVVLDSKHLAGASKAGLDLVDDEHDAVLVTSARSAFMNSTGAA